VRWVLREILDALSAAASTLGVELGALWRWLDDSGTAVLAMVTLAYVVLTHRQLHSAHAAFLGARKGEGLIPGHWSVWLHNYGPGVALAVRVHSVQLDFATRRYHFRLGEGHAEIPAGEDREYNLGVIRFDDQGGGVCISPIHVSWRTVTGKRQRGLWVLEVNVPRGGRARASGDARRLGRLAWLYWQLRVKLDDWKGRRFPV
jgi:hypothetical protein